MPPTDQVLVKRLFSKFGSDPDIAKALAYMDAQDEEVRKLREALKLRHRCVEFAYAAGACREGDTASARAGAREYQAVVDEILAKMDAALQEEVTP